MQSFASFLNKLLQLHKFVVERLIAAFSVEARQKECKIVGASEQFTHTFQFRTCLFLPTGERGTKTFPFHRQQFFDPWELLFRVAAQLNKRLESHMGITQIRNEPSDLTQTAILTRPPIFSHLVLG